MGRRRRAVAIVLLLVIGLIGLILFGLVAYLRALWVDPAPTIAWTYSVVVALLCPLAIMGLILNLTGYVGLHGLADVVAARTSLARLEISGIRTLIAVFVFAMVECLVWPVNVANFIGQRRFIKRHGLRGAGVRLSLDQIDVTTMKVVLAVLLVSTCAYANVVRTGYVGPYEYYLFVVTLVVAGLYLLGYVVHPGGLVQEIRRSPRNRLVSYLILSGAFYLIFLLGFSAVALREYSVAPDLDQMVITARLIAVPEFDAMLHLIRRGSGSHAAVAGACGLLYYTTAVVSLKQIPKLKRTPEDLIAIALAYARLGKCGTALKWIERIKDARTAEFFMARAVCHLGNDQIAVAIVEADKAAAIDEWWDDGPDRSCEVLALIASMAGIAPGKIVRLIETMEAGGVELKPGDRLLPAHDAALQWVTELLIANRLAKPEDLRWLSSRPDAIERAPLTLAYVRYAEWDIVQAYAALTGYWPDSAYSALLWHVLLLRVWLRDRHEGTTNVGQDTGYIETELGRLQPRFSSLIHEVARTRELVRIIEGLTDVELEMGAMKLVYSEEVGFNLAIAWKALREGQGPGHADAHHSGHGSFAGRPEVLAQLTPAQAESHELSAIATTTAGLNRSMPVGADFRAPAPGWTGRMSVGAETSRRGAVAAE
jgi:hypothetical protein